MAFVRRWPAVHRGRDASHIYAPLIPVIKDAAWLQGYLAAPHGTLKRDLDIIAVPWIDTASTAQELVAAIAAAVGADKYGVPDTPTRKPHGRLAWSLLLWDVERPQEWIEGGYTPWVDLSVMPRLTKGD